MPKRLLLLLLTCSLPAALVACGDDDLGGLAPESQTSAVQPAPGSADDATCPASRADAVTCD